jgi:GalNAc5-diNAcBac-PP-undecaprenol beta-1,3-glucosyltransferase
MEATVLIPTHTHGETLRYAVSSVQGQTMQDFEILIVGDGVPEVTRDLVSDLAGADPRIRFFDFPKGARNGELHRHAVLANARGRCVCYLSDDDLWLPSHLEHLTGLLKRADLASAGCMVIDPSEEAMILAFDLNHPLDREWLETSRSGFSLSSGGHTLDAYRRLPYGWRTTPEGIHTDTFMWQQFLDQPWCKCASTARPTVLRFAAQAWDTQPREKRLDALDRWLRRVSKPGGEADLAWSVVESMGGPSTHPSAQVRHSRFNPNPDYPEYVLGEKIEFPASSSGSQYLSWGWSILEGWGGWSDGEEARITLAPRTSPKGSLTLELSFLIFRSPNQPPIDIELIANGRSVARWNRFEDGVLLRSVELPAAPQFDLRFLIPQAIPAHRVADTTDHRRLGMGLLSLRICSTPYFEDPRELDTQVALAEEEGFEPPSELPR